MVLMRGDGRGGRLLYFHSVPAGATSKKAAVAGFAREFSAVRCSQIISDFARRASIFLAKPVCILIFRGVTIGTPGSAA